MTFSIHIEKLFYILIRLECLGTEKTSMPFYRVLLLSNIYSLLRFGQDLISEKTKNEYFGQKIKHGKIHIFVRLKSFGKIRVYSSFFP